MFSFQVDATAVNLRLQYSSYFLFVMVITCVLYGMIKGRPVKQNFNKKVHGPDSCVEWKHCRATEGLHRYVNLWVSMLANSLRFWQSHLNGCSLWADCSLDIFSCREVRQHFTPLSRFVFCIVEGGISTFY